MAYDPISENFVDWQELYTGEVVASLLCFNLRARPNGVWIVVRDHGDQDVTAARGRVANLAAAKAMCVTVAVGFVVSALMSVPATVAVPAMRLSADQWAAVKWAMTFVPKARHVDGTASWAILERMTSVAPVPVASERIPTVPISNVVLAALEAGLSEALSLINVLRGRGAPLVHIAEHDIEPRLRTLLTDATKETDR